MKFLVKGLKTLKTLRKYKKSNRGILTRSLYIYTYNPVKTG